MSIGKLTLFSEFFEKQAALFTVPASALDKPQKKLLQVFASIVLTKCIVLERSYQIADEQDIPLSFEDTLHRKTLYDIKAICKTYGGVGNFSFLSDDSKFTAIIEMNPEDTDKGRGYFKIKTRPLEIRIPVNIIINKSKRNHITKDLNLEGGNADWAGLWARGQNIYVFIDLQKIDDSLSDLNDFTTYLAFVRNTFRHELQHAVQAYMKSYNKLNELGGLPSKNIREKGYSSMGYASTKNEAAPLAHSFVDAEFYTDLTDSVQDFKMFIVNVNSQLARSNQYINNEILKLDPSSHNLNLVERISPQIRSILMKCWISELSVLQAKRMMQNLIVNSVIVPIMSNSNIKRQIHTKISPANLNNRFETIISLPFQNRFFLDLRNHPGGKYQKASVEFYKAVSFSLGR